MGILNVTPDSFSDGGHFLDPQRALAHVERMVNEGADLIDVGAESTRPGSQAIDEQEELRRLKPVLDLIGKRATVPLSIDTRKAGVAERAIEWGAVLINDISALEHDPRMGEVIARTKAGLVLMHMRGTPQTMQQYCQYDNVVEEVRDYLGIRLTYAEGIGIAREHVLIDPGIGFAKNEHQNLSLLKGLGSLQRLGRPILIGVSNKSFIGTVTGQPVDQRIMGTAAAVAAAVLGGAGIVRVHDVGSIREVVRMSEAIAQA
ncbi:MAG: dihydropteroate synthase [Nitrospira sp. SB0677_bin_15]|nr:dihydropteroate synthase [Nitrospira sp. SB0667_bin_9]MYD31247.1 dihydropteroate synthase [Nitrospira sp. SB0661_bin_20]MYG39437.1 dihydropteroate synthase [Nitrospira sp. SB0677_bin_15]MYJ22029.1 dihydropteroate synthase [Nitrospira sp. SB0673_bin_12]